MGTLSTSSSSSCFCDFLEKVKNSDPQKTVSQLLANSPPTVDHGPCGFRPFDFYFKLKIENQKFPIVIFSV